MAKGKNKQARRDAKRAARARAARAEKAAQEKKSSSTQPAIDRSWKVELGRELRENIRNNIEPRYKGYKHMARREAEKFIQWASELQEREGLSADYFRNASRVELAQLYIDHLVRDGATVRDRVPHNRTKTTIHLDEQGHASYRPLKKSSIEQYSKGVGVAFGVDSKELRKPKPTILEKTRSTGIVDSAKKAAERPRNASAVRFAELIGCRRGVMERLTGADWCQNEAGVWGVRLMKDKHKKNNFHPVPPEHIEEVASFFAGKGENEKIFGKLDRELDIHGIRAAHCRAEYARYAELCKDPAYRKELRQRLLARFKDPVFGCKTYLSSLGGGNFKKADARLKKFERSLKGDYHNLRDTNYAAAYLNGRPTSYYRLALTAASVFACDHWCNDNTIKHYMIS